MPRSEPQPPDVRVLDPNGPAVIDSVQAITGGEAPYCRRCGAPDTIRPAVLAGLVGDFPDHLCEIDVPVEPRHTLSARPTISSLPNPFS